MANDAFALSPISASATLPSEADYEAISEAFMETARGRWFLKEFARRNRNADTAMVLEAVARLETVVAKRDDAAEDDVARRLLAQVRSIIAETRQSITATLTARETEPFAASNKSVRIIREIAWRLREVGYDGRICDILEMQANAIDGDISAAPSAGLAGQVEATFDDTLARIDALIANDARQDAAPATATANERASDGAEVVSLFVDAEPVASEPFVTEAEIEVAAPDSLTVESIEAVTQPGLATSAATIASDPVGEAEAFGADDLEFVLPDEDHAPLAGDRRQTSTAHTPASLALELASPAAPAITPVMIETASSSRYAVAAAPSGMAISPVLDVPDQRSADEKSQAEFRDASAPSHADFTPDDPSRAESDIAPQEPASTTPPHSALIDPVAPEPASLGHSLIARGMIATTARADHLAPLRRMSQAERIAFFS